MARTVLVVTALEDVTADWVVAALNERGVPVVRVDPADIGLRLAFGFRVGSGEAAWRGLLRTESREVDLREIQAVYWRRPTAYRDRFARLPRQQRRFAAAEARHGLDGVLRSLRSARYVNHPAAVARAEFKPGQLQQFVELGLRVPASLVTNDVAAAREFARAQRSVVCKTFRGLPPGEDGRAGAIWTQRVHPDDFDDSLSVTAHLFQAEVPKVGDVRVTVVGRRVFAQRITAPRGALDWRCGAWDDLAHSPVTVPSVVEAALHRYLAASGLVFGCFDFALTGDGSSPDDWWAIECNPNGQWGWLPDAFAITEAFADILSTEGSGSS
ncbi:ATP-grasp ribosomal peptide maturase [Streptomyces anthocyanicus]|uniref:ATP-grasp ribosomal peptide maturase n=1 Tax=Streptomyces anthocyanicus TaxID=68174 RepID=UPI0033BB9AC1